MSNPLFSVCSVLFRLFRTLSSFIKFGATVNCGATYDLHGRGAKAFF